MDTKKNMSREQLLAYMRDNCTEAEAQQVRMWLRERLKDPGLDQLFSDLLDATETEYDPEGKEQVEKLYRNLAAQDIDGKRFVIEHIKRPIKQYVVGLNLKGVTSRIEKAL